MSVAWIFPGQGAQAVGMGRDLYSEIPAARAVFDEADSVLDVNVSRLCFEGPEEALTATKHAQPALLTTSIALLRAVESLLPGGFENRLPLAVAGHSLGEYSALVAGRALDFATALQLVRQRGTLMAASDEGGMAAIIGLDAEVVEEVCGAVSDQVGRPVVVANVNAPGQLVISGDTGAVEQACTELRERGAKRALPLRVSGAFHSPLMGHVREGMAAAVGAATIADVAVPLVANVSGQPITAAQDIRDELVSQVCSPVLWVQSVRWMVDQGVTTFVEFGPGQVLTGLIRRIAPGVQMVNVRGGDDVRAFVEASC
jgi:[acyl-carrier-protein] S-malonyltransferase